jgi:hypothetical protein
MTICTSAGPWQHCNERGDRCRLRACGLGRHMCTCTDLHIALVTTTEQTQTEFTPAVINHCTNFIAPMTYSSSLGLPPSPPAAPS